MSNLGKLVRVTEQVRPDAYHANVAKLNDIGVITQNNLFTANGRRFLVNTAKCTPVTENAKVIRQSISNYVRNFVERETVRGRKWIYTGSDPEVFVFDEHGVVIPAWTFLKSKKNTIGHEKPYWDGFQAEWTIAPDNCHSYSVDYIQHGLKHIHNQAVQQYPNARLTWQPVSEIPDEMLKEAKPEHVELGCAPSKNAYSLKNQVLEGIEGRDLRIRFAGFHIHLGITNLSPSLARHIVQQLDRVVGVFFVAVLDGMDNPIRRQFYGRAGEYRLPVHGLEYRVLSSATLAHPALVHLAFDLVRATALHATGGLSLIDGKNAMFRDCINNCDVTLARKLVEENIGFYKSVFHALYGEYNDRVLRLASEGAMKLVPIQSMESNWHIPSGWINHSDGANETVSSFISH